MEPTEYPAMSGSNTICVATVLLETGMVEMREPETSLRLGGAGGPSRSPPAAARESAEWVELTNVPASSSRLDARWRSRGSAAA